MLRIIAGELGGRRLRTPAGRLTRPTADRVREALFNILGPPPEGAAVLDLYAGSGALGIESLSRGAAHATFVEQDAQVCRTIATNLRELGLAERATVWRNTLDSSLLSAVLTVQILGDQMRSGGAIVTVVPECPKDGTADAAIKAAVSSWTAGQAEHFGIRGITINVVAAGRGSDAGYDGIDAGDATVGSELTKLALFLTTPAARHITGETLHVSAGALATFA